MPAAAAAVAGVLSAGSSLTHDELTIVMLVLAAGISLSALPPRERTGGAARIGNLLVVLSAAFALGAASQGIGRTGDATRLSMPAHRVRTITGSVVDVYGEPGDAVVVVEASELAGEWIEVDAGGTFRIAVGAESIPHVGSGIRLSLEAGAVRRDDRGRAWGRAISWVPHSDAGSPLRRGSAGARSRLRDAIERVGGESAPLLTALLLGDGGDVDPRVETLFRRSGTIHLLALSGMHLAVIALLVRAAVRPFAGRTAASWAAVAAAFLYLALVGPRPGLVRASLLVGLVTLFRTIDCDRPLVELLAAAFLIQLLVQPGAAGSVGFQLSYLSLLGITLAAGPLSQRFVRWLPPAVVSPLAAGVAAQLVTTPLLLYHFGTWYPIGIVATLVMGPLVLLYMSAGLIAVLVVLAARQLVVVEPLIAVERVVAAVSTPLLESAYQVIERTGWLFSGAAGIHRTGPGWTWVVGTAIFAAATVAAGLVALYGKRHELVSA